MPRLDSSVSGTRPGLSSNGGAMSMAFTVPELIAIRTVRVMSELAEVVA